MKNICDAFLIFRIWVAHFWIKRMKYDSVSEKKSDKQSTVSVPNTAAVGNVWTMHLDCSISCVHLVVIRSQATVYSSKNEWSIRIQMKSELNQKEGSDMATVYINNNKKWMVNSRKFLSVECFAECFLTTMELKDCVDEKVWNNVLKFEYWRIVILFFCS